MSEDPTAGPTRRSFLRTTATGVAAVGAASVLPRSAATPTGQRRRPAPGRRTAAAGGTAGTSLVAYVRDRRTGEVVVMSGEREVVVVDRALARAIAGHLS